MAIFEELRILENKKIPGVLMFSRTKIYLKKYNLRNGGYDCYVTSV